MSIQSIRRFLTLLPALLALAGTGCGGNADGSNGPATVRLLNLSTDYNSVDLYSNNGDSSTDTLQLSAVASDSISGYVSMKADQYLLKFRKSGVSGNLYSVDAGLGNGTSATYVLSGGTGRIAVQAINDKIEAPDSGYARVAVFSTVLSGRFDLYLTSPGDLLEDVSPVLGGAASGQSNAATITNGSFRLRVTNNNSKTDLRLDVPNITLASKSVTVIILTEATGGVLVNAVVLPQGGQPTFYDNANSARVRLLNVSSGYDSLDLYTNAGDNQADQSLFAGIASGSASAYSAVKAGSYTFKFRRTGVVANLLETGGTLTEATNATYIAYGTTSNFALLPVDEDVDAPNSGYNKLRVINAMASDRYDVYLTGASDSLNDVSATFTAAAPAAQSSAITVAAGTYRLRITGAGSKTDVRLDAPAVTLASGGVASIVLSETPGGVLVNAVLLPQQGEPVFYNNDKVRVRGAVGLSTGSAVTVNVAGTDILVRRPARSFIADTYTTLAAGAFPVNVSVDNVGVATGSRTLQAGRDYTLLVWDNGGVPQITLIPDDNRAPATNRVKLRLLNGMSGLGVPLILSADFSPVAEYIDVGAASDPADIAADNDYQLDVLNAQTLAAVLTRESVALTGGGVYTFFAAGGGGSGVAGTLRKDH